MKVVITGAKGQVGYELMESAPADLEVFGFDSSTLDITDKKVVQSKIAEIQPDIIINSAAYTAVDLAESNAADAWRVNRDGVAHLGGVAHQLGIPVFHISTDYVFSGDASSPYKEDDLTTPSGVYGESKLAGEQILRSTCHQHIVLRTSWVFGAHGNNFVKTMLRLASDRDKLSIVSDQVGSPTSARSIAKTIWKLVELYQHHSNLNWGVYHFSGSPACSWYEFSKEIFDQALDIGLLNQKPVISPIVTSEYPTPAKRPLYSVLDCSSIKQQFGIDPSDWRDELILVLKAL